MRISDWSSDVCSSDLMTRRGNEFRMHRLVREMHHPRPLAVARADPVERIFGQLVGDIALLRHIAPVNVQPVGMGHIMALALEAHPMVKAGLGRVGLRAHVPLADEGGLVTRAMKIFGIIGEAGDRKSTRMNSSH